MGSTTVAFASPRSQVAPITLNGASLAHQAEHIASVLCLCQLPRKAFNVSGPMTFGQWAKTAAQTSWPTSDVARAADLFVDQGIRQT